MNLIEKLGITPIEWFMRGGEAVCLEKEVRELEQQRDEMLEALMHSTIEMEIYAEYHPNSGTPYFVRKNIKAIENADTEHRSWQEIKEINK